MAALAAESIPKYRAAIFFDNEPSYIDIVQRSCKYITCVNIPQTKTSSLLPATSFYDETTPLKKYVNKLYKEGNYYIRALHQLGITGDKIDPVSGLNNESIDIAEAWLEATKSVAPRAAVFDFDRTITIFEGFFQLETILEYLYIPNEAKFIRDQLTYLVGGAERLKQIKDILRWLNNNGCDLWILTNNESCISDETPNNLRRMLNELFEDMPYRVICGKDFGGNKALAFLKTPEFEDVCPIPVLENLPMAYRVGGRSRATKIRRKHLRKTRRRR